MTTEDNPAYAQMVGKSFNVIGRSFETVEAKRLWRDVRGFLIGIEQPCPLEIGMDSYRPAISHHIRADDAIPQVQEKGDLVPPSDR